MALVLFIVSLLTFIIFVKLPSGDPARRAVGKTSTPEQVANARRAFGLGQARLGSVRAFREGVDPVARSVPLRGRVLLVRELRAGEGRDRSKITRVDHARRRRVDHLAPHGHADRHLLSHSPQCGLEPAAMFLAIVGVSMPVFWLGQLLL
jgi:hypothetical protein